MANIKKTIKTAGICMLVIAIIELFSAFSNIFIFDASAYEIAFDFTYFTLSLTTSIIYLYFSKKTNQFIFKHKRTFFILAIINILNGLIVWIFSFWVYTTISREVRFVEMRKKFENETKTDTTQQEEKPVVELNKTDYEIKQNSESLSSVLKDLQNSFENNLISEEEYQTLRTEAIKNFISHN